MFAFILAFACGRAPLAGYDPDSADEGVDTGNGDEDDVQAHTMDVTTVQCTSAAFSARITPDRDLVNSVDVVLIDMQTPLALRYVDCAAPDAAASAPETLRFEPAEASFNTYDVVMIGLLADTT